MAGTKTSPKNDAFRYRTSSTPARNPHVFRGRYINVTRSNQGAYRPTFRPMPTVANDTQLVEYAWAVYRELVMAFKGLLPANENHELLEPQGK